VRVISPHEIREAYEARGMIEQEAALSAARALRANVGRLKEEHETIVRAARTRDLAEISARNHAFHRLIVEASGNKVLLRLWDSLAMETMMRVRVGSPEAVTTLMRARQAARGDYRSARAR
jgi:DNA-binding GntR family transcriptional regulator